MTGLKALRVAFVAGLSVLVACGCGGGGSRAAALPEQGAAGNVARLSWSAVEAPDLAGYRIYYGTASRSYLQAKGQGIAVGLTTSYVVQGLQPGWRYFFAVTAFDYATNESDYSVEVSKLIE